MDEANREAIREQDARYIRNLEDLVKARTQQLQRAVSQSKKFAELLKQIQTMETLEEIREAAHAAVRDFVPGG